MNKYKSSNKLYQVTRKYTNKPILLLSSRMEGFSREMITLQKQIEL